MKKPTPAVQLCSVEKNSFIGYTHMVTNVSGTRLFANSTNSKIYCYNISSHSSSLGNYFPEIQIFVSLNQSAQLKFSFLISEYIYTGHYCERFYVKCSLSPDEKYLASTDSLNKVYIWKVNTSPKPFIMLDGIDEGLSDISWCPADQLKVNEPSVEIIQNIFPLIEFFLIAGYYVRSPFSMDLECVTSA